MLYEVITISGRERLPTTGPAATREHPSSDRDHTRNWVSPAAPTPRSLPARSWVGGTPDATTSMTRLLFSSITPPMTTWPHMRMLV